MAKANRAARRAKSKAEAPAPLPASAQPAPAQTEAWADPNDPMLVHVPSGAVINAADYPEGTTFQTDRGGDGDVLFEVTRTPSDEGVKEASPKYADRVIRTEKVPASSLKASPLNWRTHNDEQRKALHGVLGTLGFAGAAVVRVLEDGSYELIDGHLRAAELGDQPITVLVTDLSEGEAKVLLATYDPIGKMAGTDEDKLNSLLEGLDVQDEALAISLEAIHGHDADAASALIGGVEPLAENAPGDNGFQYTGKYAVIVETETEALQRECYDRLIEQGYKCRVVVV